MKIAKVKEIMPSNKIEGLDLVSAGSHDMQFCHGQVVNLQKLPKVSAKSTSGDIKLENVSVITPSGDVVVPDLSLQVKRISVFHKMLILSLGSFEIVLRDRVLMID